jgi:uncharacterized surface anchored protein
LEEKVMCRRHSIRTAAILLSFLMIFTWFPLRTAAAELPDAAVAEENTEVDPDMPPEEEKEQIGEEPSGTEITEYPPDDLESPAEEEPSDPEPSTEEEPAEDASEDDEIDLGDILVDKLRENPPKEEESPSESEENSEKMTEKNHGKTTPVRNRRTGTLPATGDTGDIVLWMILMLASTAGAVTLVLHNMKYLKGEK